MSVAPVLENGTAAAQAVDMRDPAFRRDPHRIGRELRRAGPLHRDKLGLWLVTRHAECRALLTSPSLGRDPRRWRHYAEIRPYLADSTLERTVERFMIFNDPPAHTRLRRLVTAFFTPAAVRTIAAAVEATANDLIDRLPNDRPFDLMRDFAQPFPVRVISDILGLPAERYAQSKNWSDALALVVEPLATRELRQHSDRAAIEMTEYLRAVLAERRRAPGDDLLSELIVAQAGTGAIDENELLSNLLLLFIAGHETTTNLIGNGVLALLDHPDQLDRLRRAPDLMPAAVEEILRYESPVNVVARIVSEPVDIAGQRLDPGEMLYCLTGVANRDEMAFADPDRFDVGRAINPHLSFGGGPHYCLGAPLARLEGAIALRRLLNRFPVLRRVEEEVRWRDLVNLRGLARLNLVGSGGVAHL